MRVYLIDAFMYSYYNRRYSYTTGGTFSLKLDDRGERLFILWNGAFTDIEEQLKKENIDVSGNNAVMLVHISEELRTE